MGAGGGGRVLRKLCCCRGRDERGELAAAAAVWVLPRLGMGREYPPDARGVGRLQPQGQRSLGEGGARPDQSGAARCGSPRAPPGPVATAATLPWHPMPKWPSIRGITRARGPRIDPRTNPAQGESPPEAKAALHILPHPPRRGAHRPRLTRPVDPRVGGRERDPTPRSEGISRGRYRRRRRRTLFARIPSPTVVTWNPRNSRCNGMRWPSPHRPPRRTSGGGCVARGRHPAPRPHQLLASPRFLCRASKTAVVACAHFPAGPRPLKRARLGGVTLVACFHAPVPGSTCAATAHLRSTANDDRLVNLS